MSKLLFLIALGVVAWLIYKLYYKPLMAQGRAGKVKLLLIALGLAFMALAIMGRAHAIFALIGAAMTQAFRLLPLIIRYMPMLARVAGASNGGPARLRTRMLLVTIDKQSGQVEGQILDGPMAGRNLADLSDAEFQQFYQSALASDPATVKALDAWQLATGRHRGAGQQQGGYRQGPSSSDTARPSREEALEILGLSVDATRDEIIEAHRRLITRLHPDKGGSNYLAARINAAKSVLLD